MYESPYSQSHIAFLLSIEERFVVKSQVHKSKWSQRSHIVDLFYKLTKDSGAGGVSTFFHTISCLDRILEKYPEVKIEDKTVALACFTLSCKWDDENKIRIEDVSSLVDLKQLWKTETLVWESLEFDMVFANPTYFLRYYSYHVDSNFHATRTRAKLILYIAVHHPHFYRFNSSHLAAAALYIGGKQNVTNEWLTRFTAVTGYTVFTLDATIDFLRDILTTYINKFDKDKTPVPFVKDDIYWIKANNITQHIMEFHKYTDTQQIVTALEYMLGYRIDVATQSCQTGNVVPSRE